MRREFHTLTPVPLLIAFIAFSTFLTMAANGKSIKSQLHDYRVVELATDLEHPWSFAFLPEGGILITERVGRVRLFKSNKLDPKALDGVPEVVDGGQGGLLDIVLHPQFNDNQQLYLSFVAGGNTGVNTKVMRFDFDQRTNSLKNPYKIFDAVPKVFGGRHFGGRMTFDRLGYLFISTGDRGEMHRAQDVNDHSGSIIRIHDDGRIPHENPIFQNLGARKAIFSLGHRNPQGMALHPRTGVVWTHEHGARGGDEINIIRIGRNYGWPVITHGINYDGSPIGVGNAKPGMEQPLYFWVPSIAPSGMTFYIGDKFPKWQNSLFIGSLKNEMLVRLEIKEESILKEERLLQNEVGRIRDVREGPDGCIYIITDEPDGRLIRLEPDT
ncbi:MAG: PQQ-dependent sugar dehydrogenase [Pseudomonadota bacterium]|nr:PQQ-dependent sugar dehydrogenase [Pseudomonadota bacterium]